MKIIKFGQRNNLLHPFMLVLSVCIIKFIDDYIDSNYKIGRYFMQILYCLSRFSFGLMLFYYTNYKQNTKEVKPFMGIDTKELFKDKSKTDGKLKILLLLLFVSYYDFIVSTIISFYIKGFEINKSIKNRIRCIQIFFSGILCYYTIRINLYKHHIFSLIIIFICFIIIIFNEIIEIEFGFIPKDYNPMILTIILNIFRTFLDTTEKYLFDCDKINMFMVIMVEGFINVISFLMYYWANGSPSQFKDLDYTKPFGSHESLNIFMLIILLFFYFTFSGFRNIYRVTTIKLYSPMVRAITEAIFDPILVGYKLFEYKDKFFYWINMICLILMVFASLIFTEFIVLYCFGLEYSTHIEIYERSIINDFEDTQSVDDNYLLSQGRESYNKDEMKQKEKEKEKEKKEKKEGREEMEFISNNE